MWNHWVCLLWRGRKQVENGKDERDIDIKDWITKNRDENAFIMNFNFDRCM